MNPGLYQKLAAGNARLAQLRERAGDVNNAPEIRHRSKVDAEMLTRDLVTTEFAIHEGREMIRELQGLLNRLITSPHQGLHRSLVITGLEQAQDRLRRELGPEPTA